MDKFRKPLLLLIHGISIASPTQLWIGAGIEHASHAVSISGNLAQYAQQQSDIPFPVNSFSLSFDESSPFVMLEAEHQISEDFSGSVRAVFQNHDRSKRPLFIHTNGTLLETFGKYHYNDFTYGLGYSLQQDHFYCGDGANSFQQDTIVSLLSLSSEIAITESGRLSFVVSAPITPANELKKQEVTSSKQFNTKVVFSYKLKDI